MIILGGGGGISLKLLNRVAGPVGPGGASDVLLLEDDLFGILLEDGTTFIGLE